ncbi:uncharacterized protein TM35_000084150 [Trypanosoma theileri]|uniref:Uncharacterized protein n=1 Tax=Trypanosoma theileri TaxID=67003 RepID=A0A1X0P112_9TRYP|nr:uncharacterized protein TM35_000084150 [Trypanosoma theileri]ORC90617.1 hypothetical protein TM35_000084150 [Trypanosoma theileri]
MASVVVQRFRECQNLLDSFISNLEAINNITSQSVVVEESFRRVGGSSTFEIPSSSSSSSSADAVVVSIPRCCTDPLGILRAFPDSTMELILAQHAEDVNALLRSLGSTQQAWYNKLQQAKEAVKIISSSSQQQQQKQQQEQDLSIISPFGFSEMNDGKRNTEISAKGGYQDPKIMIGVYAMLAVLSQMHGCLQELILALRADLSHPTRAIQLSLWLSGYASQSSAASESCVPALSLECALEKVSSRVQSEWETYKSQHMVDEAWIMLVG